MNCWDIRKLGRIKIKNKNVNTKRGGKRMDEKEKLKEAVKLVRAYSKEQDINILNEEAIEKILTQKKTESKENPKEKIALEVQQRLNEIQKIVNKLLEHY